jgi:predicted ATPase
VVFVSLALLGEPTLVGPAIAAALGLADWSAQPLLEQLRAALHPRHLLLVLDNFEHVAAAAPLVADLLDACPRLSVVATSRAPLHLVGEQEFSVPPLAIPTVEEMEAGQGAALAQVPAVALFVARARLVDPTFTLSPEQAGAVAAICRRLEGVPLALELAAGRIKLLAPVALLAQLDQCLPVLTGGPRDRPARQQTLRATIAWSYDLLSEADQAFFARLGVFVGGCSLAAVSAICSTGGEHATLESVATLVDAHLLRRDSLSGTEPRFVMLETVREFAREQLARCAQADALSRAHAHYFAAFAAAVASHLGGSEAPAWNTRMEHDTENVRAALEWSMAQAETGDSEALDLALRLVHTMFSWIYRGGARERRHLMLTLLSRPNTAAYPHARVRVLREAACLAESSGSVAQASVLLDEAMMLARATGDALLTAETLMFWGMEQVDPVQRGRALEEALELARGTVNDDGTRDDHTYWAVQVYLAVHHLDGGDLARARARAEEARIATLALGDLLETSSALDVLAHIARAEGETTTARQLFEEALRLRRVTGHAHPKGHILRYLGEIAEEQGEATQAARYYAEALALLREAWDVNRLAAVLRGVAALALAAGEPARALRMAGVVSVVHATCGTRIFMDVAPAQQLWARTSWEDIRAAARGALSPAGRRGRLGRGRGPVAGGGHHRRPGLAATHRLLRPTPTSPRSPVRHRLGTNSHTRAHTAILPKQRRRRASWS